MGKQDLGSKEKEEGVMYAKDSPHATVQDVHQVLRKENFGFVMVKMKIAVLPGIVATFGRKYKIVRYNKKILNLKKVNLPLHRIELC